MRTHGARKSTTVRMRTYPSVADCDDILNDVATDIKERDADGTS